MLKQIAVLLGTLCVFAVYSHAVTDGSHGSELTEAKPVFKWDRSACGFQISGESDWNNTNFLKVDMAAFDLATKGLQTGSNEMKAMLYATSALGINPYAHPDSAVLTGIEENELNANGLNDKTRYGNNNPLLLIASEAKVGKSFSHRPSKDEADKSNFGSELALRLMQFITARHSPYLSVIDNELESSSTYGEADLQRALINSRELTTLLRQAVMGSDDSSVQAFFTAFKTAVGSIYHNKRREAPPTIFLYVDLRNLGGFLPSFPNSEDLPAVTRDGAEFMLSRFAIRLNEMAGRLETEVNELRKQVKAKIAQRGSGTPDPVRIKLIAQVDLQSSPGTFAAAAVRYLGLGERQDRRGGLLRVDESFRASPNDMRPVPLVPLNSNNVEAYTVGNMDLLLVPENGEESGE